MKKLTKQFLMMLLSVAMVMTSGMFSFADVDPGSPGAAPAEAEHPSAQPKAEGEVPSETAPTGEVQPKEANAEQAAPAEAKQEGKEAKAPEATEEAAQAPAKERVPAGQTVKVGAIRVQYEDGRPAPDGLQIDVFNMKKTYDAPTKYKVKNGMVTGITMASETEHKIGFDVLTNPYYEMYSVVGAYNSQKLMRVYARYQNESPLWYDYYEGITGPEIPIKTLIIKDAKASPITRPSSCTMTLNLSEGGYAPEAGIPFRVLNVPNNKKSKLIYSEEGMVSFTAESNELYELLIDEGENPKHRLKERIFFTIQMNNTGCYVPVIAGGDVNDESANLACRYVEVERIDGTAGEGAEVKKAAPEKLVFGQTHFDHKGGKVRVEVSGENLDMPSAFKPELWVKEGNGFKKSDIAVSYAAKDKQERNAEGVMVLKKDSKSGTMTFTLPANKTLNAQEYKLRVNKGDGTYYAPKELLHADQELLVDSLNAWKPAARPTAKYMKWNELIIGFDQKIAITDAKGITPVTIITHGKEKKLNATATAEGKELKITIDPKEAESPDFVDVNKVEIKRGAIKPADQDALLSEDLTIWCDDINSAVTKIEPMTDADKAPVPVNGGTVCLKVTGKLLKTSYEKHKLFFQPMRVGEDVVNYNVKSSFKPINEESGELTLQFPANMKEEAVQWHVLYNNKDANIGHWFRYDPTDDCIIVQHSLKGGLNVTDEVKLNALEYSDIFFSSKGGTVTVKVYGDNLKKNKDVAKPELYLTKEGGELEKTDIALNYEIINEAHGRISFTLPANTAQAASKHYVLRFKKSATEYFAQDEAKGADETLTVNGNDALSAFALSMPEWTAEDTITMGLSKAKAIKLNKGAEIAIKLFTWDSEKGYEMIPSGEGYKLSTEGKNLKIKFENGYNGAIARIVVGKGAVVTEDGDLLENEIKAAISTRNVESAITGCTPEKTTVAAKGGVIKAKVTGRMLKIGDPFEFDIVREGDELDRYYDQLYGRNLDLFTEFEILDNESGDLRINVPANPTDQVRYFVLKYRKSDSPYSDVKDVLIKQEAGTGEEEPGTAPRRPNYRRSDYMGIYEAGTVTLKNFPVKSKSGKTIAEPIKFLFFNTQTQRFETEVTSKNGVLPDVTMRQGHFYIVYAEDSQYEMSPQYIKLDKDGGIPVVGPQKKGTSVTAFQLSKRQTPSADPSQDKRVKYTLPVYFNKNGAYPAAPAGVKIKFTSAYDEIERETDQNGRVSFDLIEDLNYMVTVDDERFSIESFPMTIKDHSERNSPKRPYMHLTCASVDALYLVDKGKEHDHDNMLESPSGRTTVTGLNFRNGEYFVNDRVLPKETVKGVNGDYEVFDVDTINMYRGEISKLAAGDFTCTWQVPAGKVADKVYYLDDAGKLHEVPFSQSGNTVTYKMGSLSLYHNVITYKEPKYAEVSGAEKVWKASEGKALEFVFKIKDGDDSKTYDNFDAEKGIEIDGKKLEAGDFTTERGSLRIKVKPEYLKKLSKGQHTLIAHFKNDEIGSANFTIAAEANASGSEAAGTRANGTTVAANSKVAGKTARKAGAVKTGDESSLALYGLVAMLAAVVLCSVSARRRKQN